MVVLAAVLFSLPSLLSRSGPVTVTLDTFCLVGNRHPPKQLQPQVVLVVVGYILALVARQCFDEHS